MGYYLIDVRCHVAYLSTLSVDSNLVESEVSALWAGRNVLRGPGFHHRRSSELPQGVAIIAEVTCLVSALGRIHHRC